MLPGGPYHILRQSGFMRLAAGPEQACASCPSPGSHASIGAPHKATQIAGSTRDRRRPDRARDTNTGVEALSPTILRAGGFQFFFYSRESREPPHIHVKKGGAVAKFWLTSIELVDAHGFNPNELRRVKAIVIAHRDKLLEAWHDYFDGDPSSG